MDDTAGLARGLMRALRMHDFLLKVGCVAGLAVATRQWAGAAGRRRRCRGGRVRARAVPVGWAAGRWR
eukprot:11159852-Lingulodinium_polyedra.AAC.1